MTCVLCTTRKTSMLRAGGKALFLHVQAPHPSAKRVVHAALPLAPAVTSATSVTHPCLPQCARSVRFFPLLEIAVGLVAPDRGNSQRHCFSCYFFHVGTSCRRICLQTEGE
jgi:hypothetical protein